MTLSFENKITFKQKIFEKIVVKGKGKELTQEGHSKVIYRLQMVDGGYPFPDALH